MQQEIYKNNYRNYTYLGAHIVEENNISGIRFSVWAPKAAAIRVVGHFNKWHGNGHSMSIDRESGIWSLFIPHLALNTIYMYEVISKNCTRQLKIDPYAFYMGVSPDFTCKVTDLNQFEWLDNDWQNKKINSDKWNRPISIYEVHLGSWVKHHDGRLYSYIELAHTLVDYVKNMGFTHIQLMPVMEHPFAGSWGYQLTGYFSANSRFGHPIDLMYFIDYCHQNKIGVILDWVPGHFSRDKHGLSWYDGNKCYETNNKRGASNKWGASNFDYNKEEVMRFLFSSALFWLDKFHIDGIRVDAVSEIVDNNGFHFLKKLNSIIDEEFPGTLMIAEDSSGRREITEKSEHGLGFAYRLNMWWTHDILGYMKHTSNIRKNYHEKLINTLEYTHHENFILSLTHDEVAFRRGSLLSKMPGSATQQLLNLKLLLAWQFAHPGKKLIFMGIESAQNKGWKHDLSLDWGRLKYKKFKLLNDMIKYLNNLYKTESALYKFDKGANATVIQSSDSASSTITIKRFSGENNDYIITAANFSDSDIDTYYIGVEENRRYKIIFSTEWQNYNSLSFKKIFLSPEECQWQNHPYRIKIQLPKLSLIMVK